MKTHKEDIDKAKSVLETQNKSMVQSLENLQNQMEHMENNMTKMMEKVKEVETQIKTVENDATKTNEKVQKVEIQMKTLESGMTKTNERVEGVDDQLNVFYEELKENSKYSVIKLFFYDCKKELILGQFKIFLDICPLNITIKSCGFAMI